VEAERTTAALELIGEKLGPAGRRLQQTRQMLADGFVQMPILFPHCQLLVAGKFVETHGDFDQHPVQGEKHVHHLGGISPSAV
jgi:hypothetical protein